ncbi:MAG: zinc ribbon domain-containing protein [Ktedonobacteraceae bacterium]|nr:zinc ribbon domain-containing protein [Ktedonobacteraceae bacterium]
MMKPISGQYECQHRSGIGLDYFTSRIDRLILQPNGRFSLIIQEHSRASNAAQSLISGQQVSTAAPEVRREGNYTQQDTALWLNFDDGAHEQGQLSWNGDGVQIGKNFFTKVSDSTLLPPTHRMKQDMDDIAKGLKIASTLGGFAVKAAKTINDTIQSTKEPGIGSQPVQNSPQPPPAQPAQPYQPIQNSASQVPQQPPAYQPPVAPPQAAQNPPSGQPAALFCDQCGARVRPGKRFCNNCGARLV